MNVLLFLLKVLAVLLLTLLPALPFYLEYRTLKRDQEKKISFKRLRILIYTLAYLVLGTVVLCFVGDLIEWLQGLPLIGQLIDLLESGIEWVAKQFSLSSKYGYYTKVVAVIVLNFAIGVIYRLVSKFVRIGLEKKDLTKPKRGDDFTRSQRFERRVIRFFHNETWFFVGQVVKYVSILLSALYLALFLLWQLPGVFGMKWLPFDFIYMLFSAGYLYPAITLLVFWQVYFFLEGIRRVMDECPELLKEETETLTPKGVDLAAIDEEVKKQFADYYACDLDLSGQIAEELFSGEHHPFTRFVADAVEQDERAPRVAKDTYLTAMDTLFASEKSALIGGNFFTEFSRYFLRYLSITLSRGDNVIFVCNTESQIESVCAYLNEGLASITSLYCKDFSANAVDFDDPIWRITAVSGEHDSISEAAVDDSNVLVTSLAYLCSNRFETEHSRFVPMVDTVVFVDALTTINCYHRQMAILNNRLKHIARKNADAVRNTGNKDDFRRRYLSRRIRYLCFDDSRTPGLDKVLKNMLMVEMDSIDTMRYSGATMVRCYNYEGKVSETGRRTLPQFFRSEEEVGALINMAMLCLAKGANSVHVFADGAIPFENYAETVAANRGQVSVNADGNNICINRHRYEPDGYTVVIAMDSGDNLPATLRRYLSMMPEKPALLIVFSRPYLLRDFYRSNLAELWNASQIERVPVEEGTCKDLAQRVLVKANAGGITTAEIMQLAEHVPQMKEFVAAGDLNAILCALLACYGVKPDKLDLFNYFEYAASHTFDENGKYVSEERVFLRRKGKVFDMINGRNMVTLAVGDQEIPLPMPKKRLTQNYIAGQNLLFDGRIYHILKVDTAVGRLVGRLAVGGKNDEVYEYVQKREYHVELSHGEGESSIEPVFQTKHMVLSESEGAVTLTDAYVSVFRAPTEVLTYGYFDVDPHTMTRSFAGGRYHSISDENNDLLFKQTYRRYGTLAQPKVRTEDVLRDTALTASNDGAMMMAVRLEGTFGENRGRAVRLMTVMLGEVLRSMFPSVADAIAVCPVLDGEETDDATLRIIDKYPKITFSGTDEAVRGDAFGFVIVEDSETDLGVVSVLMRAGDDLLRTLFGPVSAYLKWYFAAEEKSGYLHFGADSEPACFDFALLRDVAGILGDNKLDLRFVDPAEIVEYEECDFCGKRYRKGDGMRGLEDGRVMCRECAEHLVGNNKKELKAHLERAKQYLESTYGIRLDEDHEFCFESTVKLANTLKQDRSLHRRGTDVPVKSYIDDKKRVHVECDLPSANLSELLVRELTHVWQISHLAGTDEDLLCGHLALVGVQYLRALRANGLADTRTAYFESTEAQSGAGYRRLVQELLLRPEFGNNPFAYLLNASGGSGDVMPEPPVIEEGDGFGAPYVPETPDRAQGEPAPFYRSRLTETQARTYDTLLEAIRNFEETVDLSECTPEDLSTLLEAVAYDHPELFWMKECASGTMDRVELQYGCTAEEAKVMQARMEPAIAQYLEGITPEMSGYDVALTLYRRIIKAVDYDTIALGRQKEAGGAGKGIDMLRTICGVFTDGKTVCEGYARALQYLLQKCGVECAEAAGFIHKGNDEEGGAHAWNIVKIDGDYYYMDVTWDDDSNTVQRVKHPNNQGYAYFCVTEEEMNRSRDTKLCPVPMPACTATRANYFVHNGLFLASYDLKALREMAKKTAESGSGFITFKCASKAVYEQAMDALFLHGDDWSALAKAAAKANKSLKADRVTYSSHEQMLVIEIVMKTK